MRLGTTRYETRTSGSVSVAHVTLASPGKTVRRRWPGGCTTIEAAGGEDGATSHRGVLVAILSLATLSHLACLDRPSLFYDEVIMMRLVSLPDRRPRVALPGEIDAPRVLFHPLSVSRVGPWPARGSTGPSQPARLPELRRHRSVANTSGSVSVWRPTLTSDVVSLDGHLGNASYGSGDWLA